MLYLFISCIILILSFYLFTKASGSLKFNNPNMISYVFYYNFFLQTYIAVVLSVLFLDNHYIISRFGSETRHYAWLSVMYLLIAFPVGMLIAKIIFLRSVSMRYLLNKYVSRPISVTKFSGNPLKYSVWLFSIVSIIACLYTFWKIGYFPFLKAAKSSFYELSFLRISVSRNFSGNVYIRNFFAISMMPILSYVWCFYFIASRKLLDLIMASICVIFSLSILYYDFSKSPILWYLLSFVFVYYYALGEFSARLFFILILAVFSSLIAMYALSGISLLDFASYSSGPIGRIILSQAAGLFIIYDIFPKLYDFIGFSSLSEFVTTLTGDEYTDRAARIAMHYFNPDGVENGSSGVMNAIFIAEAWANFGLLGVLLSPLWVGFLLQLLYMFFLKSPKDPLYLAFFVSFSIKGGITGGFNEYIYNPGLFMMILSFGLIMGFAYYFQTFSKRPFVQ